MLVAQKNDMGDLSITPNAIKASTGHTNLYVEFTKRVSQSYIGDDGTDDDSDGRGSNRYGDDSDGTGSGSSALVIIIAAAIIIAIIFMLHKFKVIDVNKLLGYIGVSGAKKGKGKSKTGNNKGKGKKKKK